MYGCELVFDVETAAKVRAEVSSRLGGVCPCEADESCPLLPENLRTVFLPEPRVRL